MRKLLHGSDVEIAKATMPELLFSQGAFWRYAGTYWEEVNEDLVARVISQFDGQSTGQNRIVHLNSSRVGSVISIMRSQRSENNEDFFDKPALGINCANGFLRFERDGSYQLEAHAPAHRARYCLPGCWEAGAKSGLLARLLEGSFHDDSDKDDKIRVLAEVAGIAALGLGAGVLKPRALVLLGTKGENGKSQILEVLRGLLPREAVCAVTPEKFKDQQYAVHLVGKALNASDELGTGETIASEVFKAVVTGEPVMGKHIYRKPFMFRPTAQHVFACNALPRFKSGMDMGVKRRLLIVEFNRRVPEEEQVFQIGARIVAEEAAGLLAWAVDGASRALRQRRFTVPKSSAEGLQDWSEDSNAVERWLRECVTVVVGAAAAWTQSSAAYANFRVWATEEEHIAEKYVPNIRNFTKAVMAFAPDGIEHRRLNKGKGFSGMSLRRPTESMGWG